MRKQFQPNHVHKLIRVLLLVLLGGLTSCYLVQAPPEQTGFIVYCESIGFNPSYNYWVRLNADSGMFNSSNTRLHFALSQLSYFVYESNETMTFTVLFNGVNPVQVSGDQGNARRGVLNNTIINVNSGDVVAVYWQIQTPPWVPLDFIVGIAGFCLVIGGPFLGIRTVQKGNIYNGFLFTLIFTVLGICFVLAWLWG